METREASPAHFLIKIDSFSLFGKNGIDKIETREFVSGKYKWRLLIYPNGHEITGEDEEDYVSVYLAMAGTNNLPPNWEVNAVFSICLFDHISDNYRYSIGRARRFHVLNPQWGFKKFISKRISTDPSNGYLVDDKCVFGAEVLVNRNKALIECMSLKSIQYKQEFKIKNFSKLKEKWVSKEFTVGGHKWMIEVYPNGDGVGAGQCLSIFLRRVVSNNNNCASSSERVMPRYTIRIKDQSNDLKHHQYASSQLWFSASTSNIWGWHSFIELSSLNDPNRGFFVKDCCVIEIEFTVQVISS